MSEAAARWPDPTLQPVGDGWAHGFLPGLDLWEPGACHLHGPCTACGLRFYGRPDGPAGTCPRCGADGPTGPDQLAPG